jgi:hypothetical protein
MEQRFGFFRAGVEIVGVLRRLARGVRDSGAASERNYFQPE